MNSELKALIADYKKIDIDTITEDQNLMTDLGFTSVELYSLAGDVEDKFDIEFSDRDLPSIKTVGDLSSYIDAHHE